MDDFERKFGIILLDTDSDIIKSVGDWVDLNC